MAVFKSYDMKGIKESFANWISNLSPVDTPFTTATSKEGVDNLVFQWQTDELVAANNANAEVEGSAATSPALTGTDVHKNYTQIIRKVVEVSDTAKALEGYGRVNELKYQTEKAGKEIKRDLEAIFLSKQGADFAATGTARKTGGVFSLIAPLNAASPEGAVVHKQGQLTETQLFDLTEALFTAGATQNGKQYVILHAPKHASFFSSLMEGGVNRQRLFESDDETLNVHVSCIVDPLGQLFCTIPSRFMPDDLIYIISFDNFTQKVLREPKLVQLGKNGSSEKWMLEMEVGLQHTNPFAGAVLEIVAPTPALTSISVSTATADITGATVAGTATAPTVEITKAGTAATIKILPAPSTAKLGTLKVTAGTGVTATVAGDVVTLNAAAAVTTAVDVVVTSGTGANAKSVTIKVTAKP